MGAGPVDAAAHDGTRHHRSGAGYAATKSDAVNVGAPVSVAIWIAADPEALPSAS